jgi:hypothetical protein
LTDAAVLAAILELRDRERGVLVEILALLNEIETRRLYLREGHPTLFAYCTDALGYSEGAAWRRVAAARAARAFPTLETALRSGEIRLCVAAQAARVLTRENHEELLERLRGKSVREAEVILAPLLPRQTVADSIHPLGGSDEIRFSFEFEASAEFMAKLDRVRALLSGKNPRQVKLETAFGAALDAFLERHDPEIRARRRRERRRKAEGGPAKDKPAPRPGFVPAARRDEVWERDRGRCTYVGKNGRR